MTQVDRNIVEGSMLGQTRLGFEQDEVFRFTDIGGGAAVRQYAAMAMAPGIGSLKVIGPGHIMRAESKRVTAMGPDHIEVTVQWRTPITGHKIVGDSPDIELGGSLETVRTDHDKDGNPLIVEYDPPEGSSFEAVPRSIVEVDFQKPTFHYRVSRREDADTMSPVEFPPDSIVGKLFQRAVNYVGRVNSEPFRGLAPRTCLVGPIIARSDDGGETFDVDHEIHVNEETWDAVVKARAVDSSTRDRRIPDDITEGNGRHTYHIYPEINLNNLQL